MDGHVGLHTGTIHPYVLPPPSQHQHKVRNWVYEEDWDANSQTRSNISSAPWVWPFLPCLLPVSTLLPSETVVIPMRGTAWERLLDSAVAVSSPVHISTPLRVTEGSELIQ